MFCRNCGKEIDDKAVFCVHCGVAVTPVAAPSAASAPADKKAVNGFAIAGLVLSLIGLFGGNYGFLVPSILGLIFGIIGMVKAKNYSAYGLAIAALVVSIVAFVIWLIIWIAAFTIIAGGFGWVAPVV